MRLAHTAFAFIHVCQSIYTHIYTYATRTHSVRLHPRLLQILYQRISQCMHTLILSFFIGLASATISSLVSAIWADVQLVRVINLYRQSFSYYAS